MFALLLILGCTAQTGQKLLPAVAHRGLLPCLRHKVQQHLIDLTFGQRAVFLKSRNEQRQ